MTPDEFAELMVCCGPKWCDCHMRRAHAVGALLDEQREEITGETA